MKHVYAGAAAFAATLTMMTSAHALIIGESDSINSIPFNQRPLTTGSFYQQVYDADQFPGTVDISSLTFFRAGGNATYNEGTYTFSLSTSLNPVAGLSISVPESNVGSDETFFAELALSGTVDQLLVVNAGTGGGSSFTYDPTQGDLLLDIAISNPGADGSGQFVADADAQFFSRSHDFGSGFTGFGLVTEFGFGAISPPPPPPPPPTPAPPPPPPTGIAEPTSLALLGTGLALTGLARRRRR
ncbi:MAG: PEP-CTERM sorting domain-containing protein [Pseudomonadota bacterium]